MPVFKSQVRTRERSVSNAYPNGTGRRYTLPTHLPTKESENVRTDLDVRERNQARMPWVRVLIVFVIAVVLLVPGSQIYRERWTPYGMFGDDLDKNPTKHLVIASYAGQNVSWLDQIPSDWTPYRYFLDDPNPYNGLSVPRNQGREAMAYLTYIIDHYDNLPSYMVFTHGHYQSWHQVEPLPYKIRALNLTALQREHYISLRCGDQMGCERVPYLDTLNINWPGEEGMRDFWKMIIPYEELPRNISYKCCAQHAVTRKAVRRRSKEDWIRVRSPLIGDLDVLDMIPQVDFTPQWVVGAWYEKIWHVLFGVGGEYCPSLEYCNQVHFSNAIACDQPTDWHMDDGDAWSDTVCETAFDGLLPDEPANLTAFDIVDVGARLRRDRRDRKAKERQDEKDHVEHMQQVLATATLQPSPSPTPKSRGMKDWVKGIKGVMGGDGRWDDDEEEPVRGKGGAVGEHADQLAKAGSNDAGVGGKAGAGSGGAAGAKGGVKQEQGMQGLEDKKAGKPWNGNPGTGFGNDDADWKVKPPRKGAR